MFKIQCLSFIINRSFNINDNSINCSSKYCIYSYRYEYIRKLSIQDKLYRHLIAVHSGSDIRIITPYATRPSVAMSRLPTGAHTTYTDVCLSSHSPRWSSQAGLSRAPTPTPARLMRPSQAIALAPHVPVPVPMPVLREIDVAGSWTEWRESTQCLLSASDGRTRTCNATSVAPHLVTPHHWAAEERTLRTYE